MTPRDRLLRYSLRGNAAFSSASGLAFIAAAGPLARTMGVPDIVSLPGLGVQLLGFAALLVWLASRGIIRPGFALAVVVADALWVVGTVPLLLAGVLSPAGSWIATAIAHVVAAFAVLQYLGIRRMQAPRTTAAAV